MLFRLTGIAILLSVGLTLCLYVSMLKHPFMDVYILVVMFFLLASLSVTLKASYRHLAIVFAALPLLAFYLRPSSISCVHMVDVPLLAILCAQPFCSREQRLSDPDPKSADLLRVVAVWLIMWTLLSLAGSDVLWSLRSMLRFVPLVLLPLALSAVGPMGRSPAVLLPGICIALLSSSLFGVIQRVAGLSFTMYPSLGDNVISRAGTVIRYPGPTHDPQAFAQIIAALLPICIFCGWRRYRFWAALCAVAGGAGFLLAGSRAPFVGFVLGCFVTFWLIANGRTARTFLLLLLLTVGALGALLLPNVLLFRRLHTSAEDANLRFAIWESSLKVFKSFPVAGVGFGNYRDVILDYDRSAFWATETGAVRFDQPESTYLKVLVETGILGSAVFLGVLLLSLRRYRLCLKEFSKDTIEHRFMSSCFGALLGLLVAFTTVYTLDDRRILFCFVFLLSVPFFYSKWNHKPQQAH